MAGTRRSTRTNHIALAQQVIDIALERGMKRGEHLPEKLFSDICGVSRTPIRAAFKLLEEKGILQWQAEQGYFLELDKAGGLLEISTDLEVMERSLASRILADRAARRISETHTVSALVRKYSVSRYAVLNALKILSQDGIVAQLPGRTWVFQPLLDSPKAVDESLAFRLELEPQAIRTPGFSVNSKKAGLLRERTSEMLETREGRITARGFMAVDTEFHNFIAEGSANRFIRGALLTHLRLRQTTQKDFSVPDFRLRQSLREHLEIIDNLERNLFEVAADLMVLHLRRSGIGRPDAVSRAIPPLMRNPKS